MALTIRAASAPKAAIYNCGSGVAFSFNEMIAELNRNLGTSLEPDYIDNPYAFYQPHTEADMTKARVELGHVPAFPPVKGIADYVGILEGKQAA